MADDCSPTAPDLLTFDLKIQNLLKTTGQKNSAKKTMNSESMLSHFEAFDFTFHGQSSDMILSSFELSSGTDLIESDHA